MGLSDNQARASFRHRKRGVSLVAAVLLLTLLAGAALAPLGERAAAASVRIASIVSVSGSVEVKKSGGKKYFKAYKDMPLNAGDHLKTGDKSTVTIRVQDRRDEATLGSGSSLYISELRDSGGKKKSNFTLWTGSMWVKASTLVSTEDEFEIETPTAVMGVRGTNLFVGVDPFTGESMFLIASGIGEVLSKNTGQKDGSPAVIYPSQMVNTYFNERRQSEKDEVVTVNLEQLVSNGASEVLAAVIRSKQAIDEENEKLLSKLRGELESSGGEERKQENGLNIKSVDDLERLRQNLDNLVANMVNEALKQKKVEEQQIRDLVDEINRTLNQKIDLDNAKPPVLTNEEKEKQLRAEIAKQQREQQKAEAQKRLEEEQRKQQELLDRVKEQARQIQEASLKKLEEQKKKAEEEYLRKLTEEQAKAYQEAKERLEQAVGAATPSPAPTPVATSAPSSTPGATPTPTVSPEPTPTPPPLSQAGVIEESVNQVASGGANATYGPGEGTLLIKGNLSLTGDSSATGTYTLRNITIEGGFAVDLPNGSVALTDSVTVQGATTVVDVAPGTFESSATHGEGIEIADDNGARIRLSGDAGQNGVRIAGAGDVVLEGEYHGPVTIEGDATSVTLKGQFTGTVTVAAQGVRLTVDSDAQFTGTLAINADGFVLEGQSDAIGNITVGEGVTVEDEAIVAKANLTRLNQEIDAEELLAFLHELDDSYGDLFLWHAEQLLVLRDGQQSGAFVSWEQALGAIGEIRTLDVPGPALETDGALYAGDPLIVFTYDGENPQYRAWEAAAEGVYIYKGASGEGNPWRQHPLTGQGLVTLGQGSLVLDGSIFTAQDGGPGEYTVKVLTAQGFLPVEATFVLEAPDYLDGLHDLEGIQTVVQQIIGNDNRVYGPAEGEVVVPGSLMLEGSGSGLYSLQNITIKGDLIIHLPNGSVELLGTVRVEGETRIVAVSGGFETGGEGQTVSLPNEGGVGGFASMASHEKDGLPGLIVLLDPDGATVRLDGNASTASLVIAGGGHVLLEGLYQEAVTVADTAAAASLRIAEGAKVMDALVINANDVELELGGVLLAIVLGNGVGETASVAAVQDIIEERLMAILEALIMSKFGQADLSGFRQALESTGFELERPQYLYLLENSIHIVEGSNLYSLVQIKDWLAGWSSLPLLEPDLEEGATLEIDNVPYGYPLQIRYSAYVPPQEDESGEGEYVQFEWPDWIRSVSGVTISQEIGNERIERYYAFWGDQLICMFEYHGECSVPGLDVTEFHPGEAEVAIHGGLRYPEQAWPDGLFEDIAGLRFVIGPPQDAEWDNDDVRQYVYGTADKLIGPADPAQSVTVQSLTIAGGGSGEYRLRNIIIRGEGELDIDVPNGTVILEDSVRFEPENPQYGSYIFIGDIGSSGNGGGFISYSDLSNLHGFYIYDSNEARIEVKPTVSGVLPALEISGPGTVELVGGFGHVTVNNYSFIQAQPAANRIISVPEGTLIEWLELYTGSIILGNADGSILYIQTYGQQGGAHPSVTAYQELLSVKLGLLNSLREATDYNDVRDEFEAVLAFIGIAENDIAVAGTGLWAELVQNNQFGYVSLQDFRIAVLDLIDNFLIGEGTA